MKDYVAYLDENLSFEDRARDLVTRMTLEEKVFQTLYTAPAIKRLKVKAYNWWNEALHGVARAGVATVFPQAIGLAATFDEDILEEVADTISTEGRAKFNVHQEYNRTGIYKGLTFWSPNVNIFRDPRWGRGHETYGEDPYLSSRLGVRFIQGIQGQDKYMKAAACAKHYAVHSGPENLRHNFNAEVSKKDLYETYLPAFKSCVKEAKVEAVMGAYNRTNGEPCCASKTILKDILRDEWEFKGHVVSDCWAIKDIHEHHMVTSTPVESVALAINNGCDLNCGNMFGNLLMAVRDGLVEESTINKAVIRLITTRMKLGLFDSFDKVKFNKISYDMVDNDKNKMLNLKVSKKSLVLLKNEGKLLPLDKSRIRTIGVIGPNANNRKALVGNYEGTASEYITVLEGIKDYLGSNIRVYYSEGCHLFKEKIQINSSKTNDRLAEVKAVCNISDVVVACFGMDAGLEGEEGDVGNEYASGDKPNLNLPGIQEEVLKEIYNCGKPVILLLLSGSAIAIPWADKHIPAIIQCFYPGAQGGRAVTEMIFGEFSPEGKLPVTFYKTTEELPEFTDYNMRNRTYRYMKNEALYPFGYGLTYTEFNLYNITVDTDEIVYGKDIICKADIINKGLMPGGETIQVYVKVKKDGAPNPQLKGLNKVYLNPGDTKTVSITLPIEAFGLYNDEGKLVLHKGEYEVFIGTSQPDARSITLTGKVPYKKIIHATQTMIIE